MVSSSTVGHDGPVSHAAKHFLNTKMLDLSHAHHGGGSAARHLAADAPVPGHARPAPAGPRGSASPEERSAFPGASPRTPRPGTPRWPKGPRDYVTGPLAAGREPGPVRPAPG